MLFSFIVVTTGAFGNKFLGALGRIVVAVVVVDESLEKEAIARNSQKGEWTITDKVLISIVIAIFLVSGMLLPRKKVD